MIVTQAFSFSFIHKIIKLNPDGTSEEVAILPSVAVGMDFVGAARVYTDGETVYATVGSWQSSMGESASPNFSAVVSITDGEVTSLVDVWAYEVANNPDATDNLESHPFGITMGHDGLLYVADAAMNAVLTIDPATGETSTFAIFEALPGVFPSPTRNNELLRDPVPTGITFSEDGTAFVSLLTGAPFLPGTASVMQVSPEGEISEFATGLTMLNDVKMGPDGNLYAVSFGLVTEEGFIPNSGSIVRILPDGTLEVIIEGLPFATSVALDAEGNGYVTVNGIAIPEAGMVLYYEGMSSLEGQPLPTMEG